MKILNLLLIFGSIFLVSCFEPEDTVDNGCPYQGKIVKNTGGLITSEPGEAEVFYWNGIEFKSLGYTPVMNVELEKREHMLQVVWDKADKEEIFVLDLEGAPDNWMFNALYCPIGMVQNDAYSECVRACPDEFTVLPDGKCLPPVGDSGK